MELVPGRLGKQLNKNEYLIRGNKIYTGSPQVTIYYSPMLKKITDDTDELPLPEMFDELIKAATIMNIEGKTILEIRQYINAVVDSIINGREDKIGIKRALLF